MANWSMMLEAYAARGVAQPMEISIAKDTEGAYVLSTSGILREAYEMMQDGLDVCDIAASVQEYKDYITQEPLVELNFNGHEGGRTVWRMDMSH